MEFHLFGLPVAFIEIQHGEIKSFVDLNCADCVEKLPSSGSLRRLGCRHFLQNEALCCLHAGVHHLLSDFDSRIAKYLNTVNRKAAYYELLTFRALFPRQKLADTDRALFVYSVQTPALGMLPLALALQASFLHAHLVLVDLLDPWAERHAYRPTRL